MKVITYQQDKMLRAGELLNSLVVSGSSNFRALAEIADILDSGQFGEIYEQKEDKNDESIRNAENEYQKCME